MVISWPKQPNAVPPPVVATPADIQPKPCTLHGTGWASSNSDGAVEVQLAANEPARVKLFGTFAQGVEWNDIPPAGSNRAATLDISRGGVRIHALARLGDRTFWLSRKTGSVDGLTALRPGRKVKALGVEDGQVIVESTESHIHPSRVIGEAGCDDLGTDTSIAAVETPLPGNVVRPARGRWVHFLAQPFGPTERSANLDGSEIRTTVTRGSFVYAHARFANADIEGWVAQSEIKTPTGGYGTIGHGIGVGVMATQCATMQPRRVRSIAELRIGKTAASSVRLGDVLGGTLVYVKATQDDRSQIDILPCELQPIGDDKLWVESSALD